MNWFERYGIPGLYFVGLMAGWVYVFDPRFMQDSDTLPGLIAALIAISLPIGYIISILEQTLYLKWRRCFWKYKRLRGCLGFHGAAMDEAGVTSIGFPGAMPPNNRDEPVNEASTLLLTALRKEIPVDTHIYIRNWIARRADVCAINLSLIIATVLAGFVALVFCFRLPGDFSNPQIILSSISVFVILVMFWSFITLRRQIIKVIAGIYRVYR